MPAMMTADQIRKAYRQWQSICMDQLQLDYIEATGLWNKITGIWFLQAETVEMTDEKAALIKSMAGENGVTVCRALLAKYRN